MSGWNLFDAIVKLIILYACESWGNDISGSLNNRLDL